MIELYLWFSLAILAGCSPSEPIQVVDPRIHSLGSGYFDPRYIETNCLAVIDGEEIKRC